jgi:hypothetical protein
MKRYTFSKIWIMGIVLTFLVGGIFVWQYFSVSGEKAKIPEEKVQLGVIEGSLGCPGDFIPSNMKVCAEGIATEELYCTDIHIKDSKYTYGEGYKIEVPAGDYYIYATLPNWGDYKAYYSEFVVCGLKADCPSHEPILVKVGGGKLVSGINPVDWYWYKMPEEVQGETADWKTYENETLKFLIKKIGFVMKYPGSWDYTVIGEYSPQVFFGPQNTIKDLKTGKSVDDKSLGVMISAYDKILYERSILPYRKSNEYLSITSSNVTVDEASGVKYTSEYSVSKTGYQKGDKTITVDLKLSDGYLSIHLFNYQNLDLFQQMLSTFRFLQ